MTPDADLTLPPATADADATLGPRASPSSAIDAPPGFVIERELGVGGMGVVYLAHQLGLNRPVALKLVKDARVDSKALIRFLAEAEAVASIRHPNVVEVYQYGEHAGKPYMALEYCPGGDLTSLSKAEQTRDANWFRKVADLMAKVADGVNAAHALGIVHRDLKPHNVFLTADGSPKVADFGLAKRGVGSDLTQTGAVMGTPAYMAPEQAGKGTKFVGPEADVWALGVMLYELCCGDLPIDTSGNLLDILVRVAMGEVSQLRTKAPTVPTDLSLIAHKCLSLDPRDRYPTAGGLATDLRHWLDGKPISARPVGTIEQAVKWAKRNKKLAGMGLAVLLTMAVATGVSLGFGLDANAQRVKADDKAAEVEREKGKVTTALNDLSLSNEKTQRTLARALLAPISANTADEVLGVYEQNALWELAATRDGPVPLLVYDEATRTPLAAAQFRGRAVFLDHAAIGLDSGKRRKADALLAERLRDTTLPLNLRRDVGFAASHAERLGEADTISEVLLATLGEPTKVLERQEVAAGLAKVCERLPADRAAGVCGKAADVLLTAMGKAADWYERGQLTDGLAKVCERLPADRAAGVCGKAADMLLTALGKATDGYERQEVVLGLVQVCERLPADRAADVCGKAADVLTAALGKATNGNERQEVAAGLAKVCEHLPADRAADVLTAALGKAADGNERGLLAEGLAKVCERLSADRAADVLLTALGKAAAGSERQGLAAGLAKVCERLPADRAAGVCGKAADVLLTALGKAASGYERQQLADGLAKVCERLPADRAAGVCGKAADVLTVALGKATGESSERIQLAVGLAQVCERLPADRAADVLTAALGKAAGEHERGQLGLGLAQVCERLPADQAADVLTVALGKAGRLGRGQLAAGLAQVCERLPADRAAGVCGKAADVLLTALGKAADGYERGQSAVGLAQVCERLPADRAAGVCGKAADVLLTALGKVAAGSERQELVAGLAKVCERLPADRAADVLTAVLGEATDRSEQLTLAKGLTKALLGLSESDILRHEYRIEVAALAGIVTLHPSVLPKPRQSPPQKFVDLLKHPFCVMEARRAVLDALEFTYDRQFADLWEFVAFAEKEHPELDLLTPPKRPTK